MTRGERLAPVLLGVLVGSLVAGRLETALGCLVLAAALSAAAGAPLPSRAWWMVIGFGCAMATVLNLLLVKGTPLPLPAVSGLSASVEGLRLGALMSLRLAAAAVAVHGLAAAWPGERAADAMAALARPLERIRVPVGDVRAILGLSIRFVPVLAHEAERIQLLQTLRAGRPPRTIRERLERAQSAVVPIMVGALERAERVALALEARHYRTRPVPPLAFQPPAAAAGVAIAATALFWRG